MTIKTLCLIAIGSMLAFNTPASAHDHMGEIGVGIGVAALGTAALIAATTPPPAPVYYVAPPVVYYVQQPPPVMYVPSNPVYVTPVNTYYQQPAYYWRRY